MNEVNLGVWEGLTLADIQAAYSSEHAFWVDHPLDARPPSGESIAEVETRVRAALRDIGQAWPGGSVVIVTHKVTMNIIQSLVTGEALEQVLQVFPVNGSMMRLELELPLRGAAAPLTPTLSQREREPAERASDETPSPPGRGLG